MLGPAPETGSARTPIEPAQAEPAATTTSRAEPEPPPPTRPAPQRPVAEPELLRVAVIASSDVADFREVAEALDDRLADEYEIDRIALTDPDWRERLAALEHDDLAAAVAIGVGAAETAVRELDVPTIFCQVFDYEHLLSMRSGIYGVAALPPLDLQLERWKLIAPGARKLGMVAGSGHPELIEDVRRAAAKAGIELDIAFAASDREALYRFKRLAPRVNGLWLFPDNDILSPQVIKEMLDYALDHGVHGIVVNPTLLDWGALLSVSSRPTDVARSVAHVLDALTSGSRSDLPIMTPLSEIDARVNERVAIELGLPQSVSQARTR